MNTAGVKDFEKNLALTHGFVYTNAGAIKESSSVSVRGSIDAGLSEQLIIKFNNV